MCITILKGDKFSEYEVKEGDTKRNLDNLRKPVLWIIELRNWLSAFCCKLFLRIMGNECWERFLKEICSANLKLKLQWSWF